MSITGISQGTGNVQTNNALSINQATSGASAIGSIINGDTTNWARIALVVSIIGTNTNNTTDVLTLIYNDVGRGDMSISTTIPKSTATRGFEDQVSNLWISPGGTINISGFTAGSGNSACSLTLTAFDMATNLNSGYIGGQAVMLSSGNRLQVDVKSINDVTTVDGIALDKWAKVLLAAACGPTNRTDSTPTGTVTLGFMDPTNSFERFRLTVDLSTGVRTAVTID